MKSRILRILPSLVLVFAFLFVQPGSVKSQCSVASTSATVMGNAFSVLKILSAAENCSPTVVNAMTCSPTMATTTTGLFARATTMSVATTMVSCAWNCGCGTVTTTEADGLPVELMDFSIEG